MSQPQPSQAPAGSPIWILLIGGLLGGGLLLFMAWDSFFARSNPKGPAASAHVIELTDENWQKEVVDSGVPVLVDFTALWCPPCQKLAPTIHKLAEQFKGKVKVGAVDLGPRGTPRNTKLTEKFDVGSIPRVILFKRGEAFKDFDAGIPSEEMLVRFLEMALAKN